MFKNKFLLLFKKKKKKIKNIYIYIYIYILSVILELERKGLKISIKCNENVLLMPTTNISVFFFNRSMFVLMYIAKG